MFPVLLHFVVILCSLQFPVHQFPPPAKEQAQEDLEQRDRGLHKKHKGKPDQLTQKTELYFFGEVITSCAQTNMFAN